MKRRDSPIDAYSFRTTWFPHAYHIVLHGFHHPALNDIVRGPTYVDPHVD
jgi:hypothetical protein